MRTYIVTMIPKINHNRRFDYRVTADCAEAAIARAELLMPEYRGMYTREELSLPPMPLPTMTGAACLARAEQAVAHEKKVTAAFAALPGYYAAINKLA